MPRLPVGGRRGARRERQELARAGPRGELRQACAGLIAEPRFVVEVLSPSTEKEDRTIKLDFHESFPSLEAG
jgi:hypothetical protein